MSNPTQSQSETTSHSNRQNVSPIKKRILLVDDERDIVEAVKATLSGRYWLDVYGNPAQALSNYRIGFYDLILLDYKMPMINGYEFYQKVRAMDSRIKFCLMTAYEVFPSMVADLIHRQSQNTIIPTDVGKPIFLRKPFDTATLIATISSILKE